MSKILKNQTGSGILIGDTGVTVPASPNTYTIPAQDYPLWAASSNIITYIGNGNIIVNDGSQDLSISDGTDLIKGNYPHTLVGATTGASIGNVGDSLKVSLTGSSSISGAITIADGPNLDAFSRLRTSETYSLIESLFPFNVNSDIFWSTTASGGTLTHDTNKVSAVLSVTSTTNSEVVMQTYRYAKYTSGKSQLIIISGNLVESKTGVKKYIGYNNGEDGPYFLLDGATLKVGMHSKVSGSVVDTEVAQSSWNLDKLDGTGSSGITIDITKQNIFIIDFQWLGSGRVRFGFDINGSIVYCHQLFCANILTTPYSRMGSLPIRFHIKNTSTNASSMFITGCTVISEGNIETSGVIRTVNRGTTAKSLTNVGSRVPIISLRKQAAYADAVVEILDTLIFSDLQDSFLVEYVLNGTLTGASWADVTGLCQKDVSATAITGGRILASYYFQSGSSSSSAFSTAFRGLQAIALGHDSAENSDIFTIVATNLTQTASLYASINYTE